MRECDEARDGVTRNALFAEGGDVCQIYDFTLDEPDATPPMAKWLKVRDARIASVRLFFDAGPCR